MIKAVEALNLPCAQLSAEDLEKVNALDKQIDAHLHSNMGRRGCEVDLMETNPNVIAEIINRLKEAGYVPQFEPLAKRNRFNHAAHDHVGWKFVLVPSEEAYRQNPVSALGLH